MFVTSAWFFHPGAVLAQQVFNVFNVVRPHSEINHLFDLTSSGYLTFDLVVIIMKLIVYLTSDLQVLDLGVN